MKVIYTGQSFSFSDFWHMLWVCSTSCKLLMGCELWFVLRQMLIWCCSNSNPPQLPVLGSPRMKRVSEKFLTALLFKKPRLERLYRTKGRGLSILPCLGGKPVHCQQCSAMIRLIRRHRWYRLLLKQRLINLNHISKGWKGKWARPICTIYPCSDEHWRKQWSQKSG